MYNKIIIRYNSHCVQGFRFFLNKKTVLEAGCNLLGNTVEVELEPGERLLGVRSKLYDDTTVNNTAHCNMVLVLGKLV